MAHVAEKLFSSGIFCVPVPRGQKGPAVERWQDLRLTPIDIPDVFSDGQNIGVLLGAASNNLADVDLDCPEARALSGWLPPTHLVWGRKDNPRSHWAYRVDRQAYKKFLDPSPGEKQTLLELRAKDGLQTIIPPSVHPSGDHYEWHEFGQPAPVGVSALESATSRMGAAALIARRWGKTRGCHNELMMAFAGWAMRSGWTLEETEEFVRGVCRAAGDDDLQNRLSAVRGTYKKGDAPTVGFRRFATLIGKPTADKIAEWLGWERHRDEPAEVTEPGFEWQPPVELSRISPPPPVMGDLMLHPLFAPYVKETCEAFGCVYEWIAVPLLVSAVSLIGRQLAVKPKLVGDDWVEIPTVWGALVGPSGSMKTPATRFGLAPLRALAHEETARAAAAKEAAGSLLQVLEAQKKKVLEKAGQRDTSAVLSDVAALEAQIKAARTETECKRYIIQDATMEAAAVVMASNPNGVLLYRDELISWFTSLEKADRDAGRGFFLEAWNGNVYYEQDRIGRGRLVIPGLCMSAIGGIAEGSLARYLQQSFDSGSAEDGFLQRFQLLVWPDNPVHSMWEDRPTSPEYRREITSVFRKLSCLDPLSLGAEIGRSPVPTLRFSRDAFLAFHSFCSSLKSAPPPAIAHPGYGYFIAKLPRLVSVLALTNHLLTECWSPTGAKSIPLWATELATGWADFMVHHAKKVYATDARDPASAAAALARLILSGTVRDKMTLTDVTDVAWRKLDSHSSAALAAQTLEKHHWIRRVFVPTTGRTKTVLEINPEILKIVREAN